MQCHAHSFWSLSLNSASWHPLFFCHCVAHNGPCIWCIALESKIPSWGSCGGYWLEISIAWLVFFKYFGNLRKNHCQASWGKIALRLIHCQQARPTNVAEFGPLAPLQTLKQWEAGVLFRYRIARGTFFWNLVLNNLKKNRHKRYHSHV